MNGTEDLIRYGESFLGIPYVYGGKNLNGLDCSGFITEILKSISMLGYHEVLSAQGIYDRFIQPDKGAVCDKAIPGAILFFGKSPTAISHVAMACSAYSLIEAGGGDERTISPNMAIANDARVRKRGINYRLDFIAALLPKYPWIL